MLYDQAGYPGFMVYGFWFETSKLGEHFTPLMNNKHLPCMALAFGAMGHGKVNVSFLTDLAGGKQKRGRIWW